MLKDEQYCYHNGGAVSRILKTWSDFSSIQYMNNFITTISNDPTSGYPEKQERKLIPTLGSGGPQRGPVSLMCLCLYLSVSPFFCLSLCLVVCVAFSLSKRMARNCAQRMRPQDTVSNTLNGSRICSSVWSSASLL